MNVFFPELCFWTLEMISQRWQNNQMQDWKGKWKSVNRFCSFGIWSVNWLTCLFVTREEVPCLTVTWTRELERRRTARQVEPGGLEEVLTFKRLSDDGNWSQFLGGDFVEWDDIPPLMMAVAESQAGKWKLKHGGFSAWVEIFCRKIYLCLCPIVSVLDKGSIELKVHTHVLKKPKQAFECSEDKSSSWWGRENVLLMGGNNLAGQIVVATVHRGDRG